LSLIGYIIKENDMGEDMKQEEEGEYITKDEKNYDWFGYLVGALIILVVVFGINNCSLNRQIEDLEHGYAELSEIASEVMLEEVADGNWYDNCYRWNVEDGINFACYADDVWEAPCVMSFRLIDNAPDVYGDQTNFILEVKEICPSH